VPEMLEHLTDRELLLLSAQKVSALEAHVNIMNGTIARLAASEQRTQGALSFGKWAFAAVFILMGAGVGLAGLVVTLVAQGG